MISSNPPVAERLATDTIRFAVAEAEYGFEVQVFVNDVEMTSAGAGMGIDPFELLVPANRLVATPEARVVPIAWCECGTDGCGATNARIVRDGDVVRWDWLAETPMDRGVTFQAAHYDAEVARLADDHGWERPQDAAVRNVLTAADRPALVREGLRLTGARLLAQDPPRFEVALKTLDDEYQVFLRVPLGVRAVGDVAREIVGTLRMPPGSWDAEFFPSGAATAPPSVAGPAWRRAGEEAR